MSVAVKICGIKTPEILDKALEFGADYIGFVFFPKSPRHVDLKTAAALNEHIKHTHVNTGPRSVALLVNPKDSELLAIDDQVNPDFIQLHGSETPERVAQIKQLTDRPVMKALSISTKKDIEKASNYKHLVNTILFDAKPPQENKNALPGGNGLAFDWTILQNNPINYNFMLSGGLNPDNVAQAIAISKAPAVDVSSGVECRPGEKDPDLIRKFIENAKI